ncbi:hypothetical protein [uncultured Maricaulis sp.]|uniref:hypothetical protein n=1 Tax=uncultured Maricaulis sp. TaxID=174710 RepID=UPI002630DF0D|nr:hypothetical protein [uncultured Maricaulis sp.]
MPIFGKLTWPGLVSMLVLGWLVLPLLLIEPAYPDRLRLDATAPLALRLGADLLLWAHIGGGAVGLVSGAIAVLAPKGRRVHRTAGSVFFVSMFVSFLVGAGVAPFLETGQRPNTIAGILSLYLLLTSWRASRRDGRLTGAPEIAGLVVAMLAFAAGLLFMYQGLSNPSGTVDGAPPEAFVVFIVAGLAGVYGDARMLMRGSIVGAPRIVRHLWRMCTAFFIAAGSFFLGQEQLLPEIMTGGLLQFGPVLFPLIALIVWSVLVRRPPRQE